MNTGVVGRDAPLRLARAVELAFPEGGMTVSGLRREITRGRLEAEMIAGKTFVTLASIDRMRELCRVQREPDHRVSTRPSRADVPARTTPYPIPQLNRMFLTILRRRGEPMPCPEVVDAVIAEAKLPEEAAPLIRSRVRQAFRHMAERDEGPVVKTGSRAEAI